MKFGKYVEDNAVPEWASKYIQYKRLKKRIKAIVLVNDPNIARDHEKVREFEEALKDEIAKITSFYLQKEGEAIEFFQRLKKYTAPLLGPNKKIEHDENDGLLKGSVELHEIGSPSPAPSPIIPTPSPAQSAVLLSHLDDVSLDHGAEERGETSLIAPPTIVIDSPFDKPRSASIDSNFERDRAGSIGSAYELQKSGSISSSKGRRKRRKKGETVEGGEEEEEGVPERFAIFLQDKFLKGFHFSENLVAGISQTLKHATWNHESAKERTKAKKRLAMAAALEYYRGLVLLKNYAIINYTGFIKILKKAEKLTNLHVRAEMMAHIAVQPFKVSDEVDRLMAGTENIFGASFLSGDLRQAKRILRVPDRKADPTRSFVAGTFFGLNLLLAAILIYTIFTNNSDSPRYEGIKKIIFPRYRAVYTMFSALGLPILWTWVFGLDILVWTKAHINYVFIFDMDPRWRLTHVQCFEAVTSLTFMWLVAIALYVWTSSGTFPLPHPPPEYFPLILAIIFLCIIACPFNFFYRQGRKWFFSTIGRIATAPLKTVKFKDFFIADQLTSLVLVLVQIQFMLCFYVRDAHRPESDAICLAFQPKISPYLSAMPATWRFLQCLRRYKDSKDRVHLLNAGKYSCTFFVVTLSALDSAYGANVWNVWRYLWVVAATVNALYAYTWDIFMDWSVLYYKNGKLSVRKNRTYPYGALYVWAAISNFILRFTWSLTKSNLLQLATILQWRFVVLVAAAEILRRGQWNLFRLENEHLNNCGKFRAVQELQLPM